MWMCEDRRSELAIVAICAGIGISIDSALALSGMFEFSHTNFGLPIPLWLVAIWCGFASSLRHSMRPLIRKPKLAIPLIAFGAPLSYLAAERFGAVDYPNGPLPTALILGVVWFVATYVFIKVVQRVEQAAADDVSTGNTSAL